MHLGFSHVFRLFESSLACMVSKTSGFRYIWGDNYTWVVATSPNYNLSRSSPSIRTLAAQTLFLRVRQCSPKVYCIAQPCVSLICLWYVHGTVGEAEDPSTRAGRIIFCEPAHERLGLCGSGQNTCALLLEIVGDLDSCAITRQQKYLGNNIKMHSANRHV